MLLLVLLLNNKQPTTTIGGGHLRLFCSVAKKSCCTAWKIEAALLANEVGFPNGNLSPLLLVGGFEFEVGRDGAKFRWIGSRGCETVKVRTSFLPQAPVPLVFLGSTKRKRLPRVIFPEQY
jgi:hypothetical protein